MRKNIFISIFVLASTSVFAQSVPTPPNTNTTTTTTPLPETPATPKVVSFYNYSYRSFVGVANPGPVNLIDGDMHMHVLALKYNLNEKWSARAGSAYVIHTFNVFDKRVPTNPSMENIHVEGFSDLRLSTGYSAFKNKVESLDFSLGLNVPTAVTLRDEMGRPLSPQDQFSSGTYDIMPVINYSYNLDDWTFTEKMDAVFHTGKNSIGYRLGDDFGFTTAVSYNVKKWLVPVLSARYTDRKELAINEFWNPRGANLKFGSGWEGTFSLRSGLPLKADQSIRLGFEAGAPIFKTSRTSQYIIGETLWYVATNLTASY